MVIKIKTRQSFLNADFKVRSSEKGKRFIEGYFIRYNEETNLFGTVYEEISPEAVIRSLDAGADIKALLNHNTEMVLGRTGNKTLTLRNDSQGLFGSIEINENDSAATNALARVDRGDMSGASFGFVPLKEDIEERADGSIKFIVRDMELMEISPVTFPAYPTTSISARNKEIDNYRKRKLTAKKEKLRNKLKGEK